MLLPQFSQPKDLRKKSQFLHDFALASPFQRRASEVRKPSSKAHNYWSLRSRSAQPLGDSQHFIYIMYKYKYIYI